MNFSFLRSVTSLLMMAFLMGCANTPEGRQQQAANAVVGAVLGVVLGALAAPQRVKQCRNVWDGWHWVRQCRWVTSQGDEVSEWSAEVLPAQSFQALSAEDL